MNRFWRSLLCLALVGLLAACGGLSSEPRLVATTIPPTLVPDQGFPAAAPDLANGARIFAQNCTDCHGVNGEGDGPLVASGQVVAPGNFTDPAAHAGENPAAWFGVITNGRIERLMPPWREALTEQERWDVAFYTYTRSLTPEQVQAGAALWQDNYGTYTAPDATIGLDDTELAAQLNTAAGGTLSVDDQAALTAYVRTLALQNPAVIGQEVEVTAEPEVPRSSITGQVVNGTTGASVPPDLAITLFIVEQTLQGFQTETYDTVADAEGRYIFADVPIDPDKRYVLRTIYRDRVIPSDIVPGAQIATNPTIPLTIYELTQDPSVITISSIEMQAEVIGDGLQIIQAVTYRNNSERLYTNDVELGPGSFVSVVAGLPPGAISIAFPADSSRFFHSEEDGVIVDSLPVMPNDDHVITYSYFLPYDAAGAVIEQPVYYRMEGQARALVFPEGIQFTSNQMQPGASIPIENRVYKEYLGQVQLENGEALRFDLLGNGATAADQVTITSVEQLPILLIVGLIVEALIVGGLLWLYLRRRRSPAATPNVLRESLVQQIAELDAAHDAGTLDDASYQTQRAALKTRLTELMQAQPPANTES